MLSKKKYLFYFVEVIALLLVISWVSIFYLNQAAMGLFANADVLCIPRLFQDIASGGYFKDWVFPTTAMFIPDWLVFLISFMLTKNIYYQWLITACLNVLLLYVVLRLIYRQFFSRCQSFIFSLASISFFLVLATKVYEPYIFIFVVGQHAGAFIMGLLYVYIQMRLIDAANNETKLSTLLFFAVLICLAVGLSDLLFIIQFALPVLFAYMLMFIKKQINIKQVLIFAFIPLCFACFGGALIPYVMPKCTLWHYLDHPSLNKISLTTIKYNSHYIIDNFVRFKQEYWIFFAFLIFYLVNIFIFCRYIIFIKSGNINNIDLIKKYFLNMCLCFSVIFTLLAFVAVKINPTLRYLEPLFFFPILLLFFIGSFFKKRGLLEHGLVFLAFFTLLYIILIKFNIIYKQIDTIKTRYYPDDIACVDQALEHGQYGIAGYWDARPFSMFSQKGLKINEVFNNLAPFPIATNTAEISKINSYSFAIVETVSSGLNESHISKFNGLPDKTVICGNKKLLIYPENKLKVPRLVKKGDEFTWPAAVLYSKFPETSILDSKRIARSIDTANFLSFGPYILLPEGPYHFLIRYSGKALANIQIGILDIYTFKTGQIFVSPMFGTENKTKEIRGEFYVNKMQAGNEPFEIRIYFLGGSQLVLDSLKIIKD